MKVLLVSLSNIGGGAARALDSLALSLQNKGINVEVLLYEGRSANYPTIIINKTKFALLKFRLKNKFAQIIMGCFKNDSHDYRSINIFNSKLIKLINKSDADVINFHWIGAEMLSIEQMSKIKKPIVWFLHDAWIINGIYHVSPFDYHPFEKRTGHNVLDSWCMKRKIKSYSKVPMHYMAPSKWIKDKYEQSSLKKPSDTFVVIRNIINKDVWYPRDKNKSKVLLNFDTNKVNVLFIARNITTNFNKGYVFVQKLIERCDDRFVFHFIGTDDKIENKKVIVHGSISQQEVLANYYSAADMCIVPSLSESMSYTALESIFCNTPVLCFDTTGLSEIVKTGVNGYKAKKFDVDDLLLGMEFIASHSMHEKLQETVVDYFPELNVNRFIEEYKKVIKIWQNQH